MSALAALEQPKKHSPLPNSYWVVPGRLAAGEHPGAHTLSDTTDRLQALLFAGVTLFIDLTEETEGLGYDHLLIYATGAIPLKYVRHPIADHGVPASRKVMKEILTTIEQHLAKQGVVYVHGRSGIGRTATVIGCYLVGLGMSGDDALERLNEMWQESERSVTCSRVPENKSQTTYIQNWQALVSKLADTQSLNPSTAPSVLKVTPVAELPVVPPADSTVILEVVSTVVMAVPPIAARLDRFSGALIGMAIGEAFGAKFTKTSGDSNTSNGGDARSSLPRVWLSDTAMCWCLAESYLACQGINQQDQMQRYLEWQRDGRHASDPTASRALPEMQRALLKWEATQNPIVGSLDQANLDPHTLARTTAVAMYHASNFEQALIEAVESARTSLQAPLALDANRVFVVAILDALNGTDKDALLSFKKSAAAQRLRSLKSKYPILQIMDGWWRGPVAPENKVGDALAVLKTVLWAFERSVGFHEGLVLATSSSSNPSNSGATFGALAGAYYGVENIPQEWRNAVLHAQPLMELAQRLANRN
jgi:ADP-ribosyl-[dinitrogen reductase] hydrolase